MATLAEILARKAAKASADEIRNCGGMIAPGMVIRAADEKAKLSAEIKSCLDESAPKITPLAPEPRELGEMTEGEQVPMDHPPAGAPEDASAWFASLHSFSTDLCIVIDPTAARAWVAVNPQGNNHAPILLHSLPLHNRCLHSQPF